MDWTVIHSVAVLGAGVMGAQIAAHFANAGVPVLLLDVTADAAARGLQRARTLKPDPAFTPDTWTRVGTAGFDEGLPRLADVDWTVEAVIEQIDAKRDLFARIDAVRRSGSLVSSNTSGIPLAALAEGRSDDFRRHFLGTHFFNPPRYLRLLEIIATADTDPRVVERVRAFADLRLGKGVVLAKDSPNFIGNHLALYEVVRILGKVAAGEYTIEEVDAITGPPIGRPKSATFRTLDLAGIDVLAHVVANLHERLPDERARHVFVLPPFVQQMLLRGLTGEKAGAGFYTRRQQADGASEILTIDPATLEYRSRRPPTLPSLEAGRAGLDTATRVRALFTARDRTGELLRTTLAPALVYAASVAPEIAYAPDDVDRAMRWGFGWELGPFELIDAIGVQDVLDAARSSDPELRGGAMPAILADALASEPRRIRQTPLPPAGPGLEILRCAKEASRIVKANTAASLVDLGDGVLCIEFHSKLNVIGGDTIDMIAAGAREAARNFAALVVGSEAPHFSAGANLLLVLLEAQDENWDDIDLAVRAFQQANTALRYSDVPVVVAPAGLAIGGGCEVCLHADRVQAAAETYMGLVEVGVGLIPAAGGTKEMVARAAEGLPPGTADLLPPIQRAFETIGFARVSGSAPDAARQGFLRSTDGITMNRDRLIADAKARALQRVAEGYRPPPVRTAVAVGGDAVLAPLKLGIHLAWRAGRISDHDALIGRRLATIMAGGTLPHPTTVSEAHLLDLEREAFLGLVAEPKTQERMRHTLKTGKPLRN
jgi:3-hydroxyacyl-CoA dehydrogenase